MNKFLTYVISRTFWRSLLIAIGIALFFVILIFSCIRIYTHHGRSYAVPDFTDLHINDAIPVFDKKNLRYEIFDSLYVATKEPGVVLEQHPQPGFLVKKNRKLYLTINASGPEKIPMPDLVEITFREAKARILSSGLELGNLSYRFDISENVVLEQRVNGTIIEYGDSIPKGTSIDLVLGKGLGNEKSVVPDLLGLTIDEAKEKVSNAIFSIGAIVPDGTVDEENDTIPARIFRQRPISEKGVLIPLGSTVTVWTTTDSTKLPQVEIVKTDSMLIDWPEVNNNDEKDTTLYTPDI